MSETVTVATPDSAAITGAAERSLNNANSMVIDSPEMYQVAADDLSAVKRKQKELEEQRTGIVKPLNEAVKRVNDLFRSPMEFLTKAEGVLKIRMLTYQNEQERKRQEEAARIRREQEERAAQERRRIEEQRRADEERARIETERLEQEKATALAAGDTVKASKIEAKIETVTEVVEIKNDTAQDLTALVSVSPVAQSVAEVPKVKGVSTRTVFKTRLTNRAEAQKFCADNAMFQELFVYDEKAANKLAAALKGNMPIPGIEVYEDQIISSRAA